MGMTGRLQRAARESACVAVGQVVSLAGAIVLVRVLTGCLQPEEYGILALGMTMSTLVDQIIMGGITCAVGRFYIIAREKDSIIGYRKGSWMLMGLATVVVAAVVCVVCMLLRISGRGHLCELAIWCFLLSVVMGWNSAVDGMQNAARRRVIVAVHAGLSAWLKIAVVMLVVDRIGISSTNVVKGYVIAAALVLVSRSLFLRRAVVGAGEPDGVEPIRWLSQMCSYAWQFTVWGVFTWLQQASDKWALGMMASTHDVGMFAVIYQLGYVPVSLASAALMSLMGPILNQKAGDAEDLMRVTHVRRLTLGLVSMGLIVTVGAFVAGTYFHGAVFSALVAVEYRAASPFLAHMILAGGLFALGQLMELNLMSQRKTHSMLAAKIGSASLGVLFNILGAMYYGLAGVVAAITLFALVYFCWMILVFFENRPPAQKRILA